VIKVALRCDASAGIGGGHVMRCLALAEALESQGCGLVFLVRAGTGEAAPALSRFQRGHVAVIEGGASSAIAAIRAHWPSGADWAVVDNYAIDAAYEAALRASARRIMAIEDLADRGHDCDLLLDQTFGRRADAYAGRVPASARVLAGSDYALLRAEFAALRPQASKRRRESLGAERILIAMGLTDLSGITLRVARAALAASPSARFEIVLGAKAQSLAPLESMAESDGRLRIHVDPTDLGRLLLDADIGIGALGTMTWERCCLGLPSIGIALVDNQRAIAEEIGKAKAALVIRDAAELEARLPELLGRLSSDAALRHSLSRNAAAIVDGQGSRRVARAMLEMVPR
jgi:UDP-2,4-diacetamido-2,4,6-trideoxy-beta-L-altropyranose hydrolase